MSLYMTLKGERSANKFRKSQIRIFADLDNLRTFRKCGQLRICQFQSCAHGYSALSSIADLDRVRSATFWLIRIGIQRMPIQIRRIGSVSMTYISLRRCGLALLWIKVKKFWSSSMCKTWIGFTWGSASFWCRSRFGINMEIRIQIRIGISTMPIHNIGV